MKLKNTAAFSIMMLAICLCGPAVCAEAGVTEASFRSSLKDERTYYLYTPPKLAVNQKYPLVMVLHGGSRHAKAMMEEDSDGLWNKEGENRGWFIVYPSATSLKGDKKRLVWNDCRMQFFPVASPAKGADDVAYLSELIEDLQKRYPIDEKKIFITGVSNGGAMTLRMAFESKIKLAGIAPVVTTLRRKGASGRCKDGWHEPLKTAYLVGTEDPLVPYKGSPRVMSAKEMVEFFKKKNGATQTLTQRELPDRHLQDGVKGSSRISLSYYGVSQEPNLLYIEVKGGGHNLPGSQPLSAEMRKIVGVKNRDESGPKIIASFFAGEAAFP
jgi:polyhydroxybutyrate depolymerase